MSYDEDAAQVKLTALERAVRERVKVSSARLGRLVGTYPIRDGEKLRAIDAHRRAAGDGLLFVQRLMALPDLVGVRQGVDEGCEQGRA